MFENIKTNYIEEILLELGEIAKKYRYSEEFDKSFRLILPNVKISEVEYYRTYFDTYVQNNRYEFKLGNITYGFEEGGEFAFIKVNDIVIFHNRDKYSCDGYFESVESGWNHTTPKALLKQIRKDSHIIEKHIKEIKVMIKTKSYDEKYRKEKEELERIFG